MIACDWIYLTSGAGLLVLLNAIFVASEFSLIKLRYSHFNPDLLEELEKSLRLARLLGRIDTTLRFLRLGVTFSTLLLGMVLVPLIDLLSQRVGYSGDGLGPAILYGSSLLVAMSVHFILGELVPRAVSMQHPVETVRTTSWLIIVFLLIASPFLKLLDFCSSLLLKLLRLDPDAGLGELDLEAQIKNLDADSEIPDFTRRVFKNVISMRELVVQDVMLPRNQIQYFDLTDGNVENVGLAREAGHTRYPLCEDDLDNCVGIIHIKDLFRADADSSRVDLKKMARPVIYFGPDDHLESVLEKLLETKLHMALVRDKFGGTVGAITMENIVEELVGNIQDEFDSEAEQIEEVQEDVFIVDGLTPIHDVEEKLDMEIEEEEVSTIGGLITSELGKIPEAGQTIRLNNLEIEAVEVDQKRVLTARVKVISPKRES